MKKKKFDVHSKLINIAFCFKAPFIKCVEKWLLRSTVRILACHAEDRGSTPLEAANALYGLKDRTNQASEATVMLKPISLLIKVNPPLCRKTNIFVELIFRQIICRLSL